MINEVILTKLDRKRLRLGEQSKMKYKKNPFIQSSTFPTKRKHRFAEMISFSGTRSNRLITTLKIIIQFSFILCKSL